MRNITFKADLEGNSIQIYNKSTTDDYNGNYVWYSPCDSPGTSYR